LVSVNNSQMSGERDAEWAAERERGVGNLGPAAESDEFECVLVWFNGNISTSVCTDRELRDHISRGGGKVSPWPSGRVTHWIAASIPPVRAKELVRKRGLWVVKPEWVLKCVEMKKRVYEGDWEVESIKEVRRGGSGSLLEMGVSKVKRVKR